MKLSSLKTLVRHGLLFVVYGLVAVLGSVLTAYLIYLRGQPNLQPWHTASLTREFRASDRAAASDFSAYLAQEEEVFRQLQVEVYDQIGAFERRQLNRFSRGSRADPSAGATNWNRTFVLPVDRPRGAVLLLHGLSDSPYSLRALGQSLHQDGFYVIGLRLPGHGTAPVGLTRATMEDFSAATRLATRHLRQVVGSEVPLFLMGYSNGGALAVDYALAKLEGEDLPVVNGLILLSPAVAVTAGAALASWQRRLASLPGMEKVAWQSIGPEYEPYKYNSFAVNAGEQIHRLTSQIERRLNRLDSGRGVSNFPPVLAFQSVVDSTIVPRAVIDRFLRRLAPGRHELVLFDIRRDSEARALMVEKPESFSEVLMNDQTTPFGVTALTSVPEETRALRIVNRAAGSPEHTSTRLELQWPPGIFSLSHVALPFPPEDPIYGNGSSGLTNLIPLGHLEARGENGVLAVSPSVLLRLRYNPFFSYMEQRIREFCRVPGSVDR